MLREMRVFKRKKSNLDEIENVPINPTDSSVIPVSTDSTRPPLNTIPVTTQNTKSVTEQESGLKSKVDRTTPSKVQGKGSNSGWTLRTPEKQGLGFSSRSKFGWAHKNELSKNGGEMRDESTSDVTHNLPPSSRVPSQGNGGLLNVTPRSVRTVGRTTPNQSECSSTQSTPPKSVTKPTNTGLAPFRPPMSIGARLGNFGAVSKGFPISSTPASVVNTVEVPHFELREDPSFWMDHNVQVLIRVRPLNNMERSSNGYSRCLKQESAQSISWIGQHEARFTFDHVACETVNQEMLFRVAGLPMVENCLSGYNSCMFAYGQTGSGKTHTMLGEIADLDVKPSPERGMTPRIFEFLFARIRAEEESRMDEKLKYNCKCSFLEIYNEQITDLLDPSCTNLLLREDNQKGVYVENLTEFEVQTVNDILRLLTQGAANRKVAATNMNRESSRSHSVFTCVIESRWEKDSTSNLRFARLNLVDLAGSERQKTSGAEGDRLKEAANINKSLSTLGHVIMVLVDVAHGKQRHIPYRDSRLTFLLQDSLGGNSKTMIIANVSPSICSAAETLSTLKFAQRAKLIQNNAVVNEDASGDVIALQHQIRILKEELAVLKRQNVSRSLSFRSAIFGDADGQGSDVANAEEMAGMVPESFDDSQGSASLGIVRLSTKQESSGNDEIYDVAMPSFSLLHQMKSLESTLTGALRREQMADTSIRQLEAEIEQLNRLVRQREEDTQCTKMMLRFREDKIQRMESVVSGVIPPDAYLSEENNALSEELQLLRAKVDRNPEVTRFALENIRLLEKLRKFQDFYGEGERELLLAEVSELRDQLLQFLDENTRMYSNQNVKTPPQDAVLFSRELDSYKFELKKTHNELEDCKNNLNSCLEINSKLTREIEELHSQMKNLKSSHDDKDVQFACKESLIPVEAIKNHLHDASEKEKVTWKHEIILQHTEDIMNLQLELDILKIILQEERSSRVKVEEKAVCLGDDLEKTKEMYSHISRQYEDAKNDLKDAKSVIEALESQQILSMNDLEDLKSGDNYLELLSEKEQEISILKAHLRSQELRHPFVFKHLENDEFSLQTKLKGMHDSLEKAKRLNSWYKSDRAFQTSSDQEMEEARRQVEAETAEVIVCLQEELITLQQQVEHANAKYVETKESLKTLETEKEDLQERLYLMTQDKECLHALLKEKHEELNSLSVEWERLAFEIEEVIADGHGALKDASDQADLISRSFPQRTWISEQVGRMMRTISEKEVLIDELRRGLEEAQNLRGDMEWKLRSLRGAALAIAEVQLQESSEKEKEVLMLTSELEEKTSIITELENIIKKREDKIRKAEICATVAFVTVNRFSEKNSDLLDALKHTDNQLSESIRLILEKDTLCHYQFAIIKEAEQQIQALGIELECSEESCINLKMKLSEEQEHVHAMERKLDEVDKEDILKTREKLDEFKLGVSTLNSCINEYSEQDGRPQLVKATELRALPCENVDSKGRTEIEKCQVIGKKESDSVGRVHKDVCDGDTIVLLRKEIESALDSLREVQAQMVKLREEKEVIRKSEVESWMSMKCITSQVLTLQSETEITGKQSELKITELERKLQTVDETVQEARSYWFQKKEVLEAELSDTKVIAAQKTAEASSLLAKLVEAQETMKDAELMVNALMTKNETAKLEIERLKKLEVTSTSEWDSLIHEVRRMRSSNDQKDQKYENLERQLCSELSGTRSVILALEDIITEVQTAFKEEFNSIVSDFHFLKSEVLQSTSLTRSWLEDIWSEIIVKDCAVSVLHLCHMGVLLEAVTGLNAENGLVHHGLCESNSFIADLKEHNFKAKKELEMCRILKGKLLVDIKNSFDRVSRKEDETGKFSAKLSAFEKKIFDLQLQEEQMLARSNSMGSELALLMKDLDLSNINALTALLDQEKLLTEKDELILLDSTSKDFESLILASELKQMAVDKATLETEQDTFRAFLENIKKEVIFLNVEAEMEKQLRMDLDVDVDLLKEVVEETVADKDALSHQLKQGRLKLAETDEVNKTLARDIQSLKEVASLNDKLKDELGDVLDSNESLSSKFQALEIENERLVKELETKEAALEHLLSKLQMEMDRKNAELKRMSTIEEENETLKSETKELKVNYCRILEDFQEKNSEIESSYSRINVFDQENHSLKEKICSLETCIASLHTDRDMRNEELDKLQHSQSIIAEELNLKSQDLEIQINIINSLKDDNGSLRSKLMSMEQNKDHIVSLLTLNSKKCSDSFQAVNKTGNRIFEVIDEKSIVLFDKMLNEIRENEERVSKFIEDCECLENFVKELMSENLSLQSELSRKDEVLEGLLFDLSLLQESASNAKDQKDEFEEMVAAMETLEGDLALRSAEIEEAVVHRQMLEAQLQEKINLCSILEMDISVERNSLQLVRDENVELRAEMKDVLVAKGSIEEELIERSKLTERLEEELFQMDSALGQMNTFLEGLKNDLNRVTNQRDHLNLEVLALKEKLKAAQSLAEENEAIAVEARQIAESRKTYAEEKEEEVKLLERSVEELEYTVDVLENKVDIVKGEAERQRLQREELEMEVESIRNQMLTVQTSGAKMNLEMQSIMSGDAELQRHLEEKENDLQEAREQIKDLEKNMAEKDVEISQCRAYISELNFDAEAQAREYKQKFKALEAMVEHVKPEPVSSNTANSLSTKPEKIAVKSRGSGSPFKCIGLGLTQQIKSEKDEELTAGRRRIEELEALAANRQKEIFMLNARLAAAESMTHDVFRDLLGVKLDMTNCASLLDHQQTQKVTEKTGLNSDESLVKDQEVVKLKQQLNEFIEERQGWLEEINRRHAEMVALRVASEKLRQRDQLLTTENETLKMENVNHKKRVMELEDEVKKLSGQQNLQQRIHHHAKIKEENNVLKVHNEDLSAKLRRTEAILSRVKEELARYRASDGKSPFIDLDEEQRLQNKLKETEEERLQLAQKLLSLCTSILKTAGITRPASDVNLSVAEDALDQLNIRIASLERELQDLEFKNKITSERLRLSELKQQSSPLGSRTDENCTTPRRTSQTPFLTTLDR